MCNWQHTTFCMLAGLYLYSNQQAIVISSALNPVHFALIFQNPSPGKTKGGAISRGPNRPNNGFLPFYYTFVGIATLACQTYIRLAHAKGSPRSESVVMSHAVLLIFECGLFGLLWVHLLFYFLWWSMSGMNAPNKYVLLFSSFY